MRRSPARTLRFSREAPPSFLLLALLLLALSWLPSSCSEGRPPQVFGRIEDLARGGKCAEARSLLETSLRDHPDWDLRYPKAHERLRFLVDRYTRAYEKGEEYLEDLVRKYGRNDAIVAARSWMAGSRDRYLKTAVRRLLSELPRIAAKVEESGAEAGAGEAASEDAGSAQVGQEAEGLRARDLLDRALDVIEGRIGEEGFAVVLEELRALLLEAGSEADKVRERIWAVQARARKAMKADIARAETLWRTEGSGPALSFLEERLPLYPERGPLAGLLHLRDGILRETRAAIARKRMASKPPRTGSPVAPPPRGTGGERGSERTSTGRTGPIPPRPPVSKEGGDPIREGEDALARRDFREAARRFDEVARTLEDAASAAAGPWRRQADLCGILAACLKTLSSRIAENPKRFAALDLGGGRKGRLKAYRRGVLTYATEEGEEVRELASLSDPALASLFEAAAKTAGEKAAAAWLDLRAGRSEAALALCRKAWEDEGTRDLVSFLVALSRDEVAGPGGYELVGGAFFAPREIERIEKRKSLLAEIDRILRLREDEERERRFTKLLEMDASLLPVLSGELRARRNAIRKRLSNSKVRASLRKLRAVREELDKRRAHAMALIFDTEKYFYPYRPPAVSPEKAKEYWKVQAEVDRRVAAVREVWEGKQAVVSLPKKVAAEIETFRWIERKLRDLGEAPPKEEGLEVLLARARTDIRNFALDERDARRIRAANRILEENRKKLAAWLEEKRVSRAEADLIQMTNRYRMMMGVPPLRADSRLILSSHGHSREMSKLGYFSHFSPNPQRKTPSMRMKLAGYPGGGGENIALHSSVPGAFDGWLHSSGHHRNLLRRSHKDLGCGIVGRYYTQNFGAGTR